MAPPAPGVGRLGHNGVASLVPTGHSSFLEAGTNYLAVYGSTTGLQGTRYKVHGTHCLRGVGDWDKETNH